MDSLWKKEVQLPSNKEQRVDSTKLDLVEMNKKLLEMEMADIDEYIQKVELAESKEHVDELKVEFREAYDKLKNKESSQTTLLPHRTGAGLF